jgi:hypothetical protein
MILQDLLKKNKPFLIENIIVIFSFAIFFLVGINVYKDYGISVDEPFQRSFGYFWYIWINENFIGNPQLIILKEKFSTMEWSNILLMGQYIHYGVFFDVIAAFFEEKFKLSNDIDAYHFRHITTFLFFYVSSVGFFLLSKERFKSNLFSLIITFIYVTSPRIFGESFYNNKDIVFMSLSVFTIYFSIKSFSEPGFKNIFFLSFFSVLATEVRILGIFFFLLYFIFFIISCLEDKKYFNKNVKYIAVFIFSYVLLSYILWPYLWENPLNNFFTAFKFFSNFAFYDNQIFFMGEFISATNLPWYYIPVWIIVSTPVLYLLFFFISLIKYSFVFFQNFLNIKKTNNNKIWNSISQKQDLFLLLCFLGPLFAVISLNSTLYTGWRHLYFIYPPMIYFVALGIKYIIDFKKKIISYLVYFSILVMLTSNIYNLIKFHPYQNVYFNFIFEKNANKLFEVDYWGLGNLETLKHILKVEKKNKVINIRTASFTPLNYSKHLLKEDESSRINLYGTVDLDQEYVFTNFNYEKNPKLTKKYKIKDYYEDIFTLKRGNIVINRLYKKNK